MKAVKRDQTHCGIVLGNFYLENYFSLVLFDRNPAHKKKLDLRQSETSLRKYKLIFYFSLRKMQINIRG